MIKPLLTEKDIRNFIIDTIKSIKIEPEPDCYSRTELCDLLGISIFIFEETCLKKGIKYKYKRHNTMMYKLNEVLDYLDKSKYEYHLPENFKLN